VPDERLRRLAREGDSARLERELARLGEAVRPHGECDWCGGLGMYMSTYGSPESCPRDHTPRGVLLPVMTRDDIERPR